MVFYEFWVEALWGSEILSVIAFAAILAIIGMLGKFSTYLLLALFGLFFMVFGTLLFGIIVWLPILILSISYLFIQIWNFAQR